MREMRRGKPERESWSEENRLKGKIQKNKVCYVICFYNFYVFMVGVFCALKVDMCVCVCGGGGGDLPQIHLQ